MLAVQVRCKMVISFNANGRVESLIRHLVGLTVYVSPSSNRLFLTTDCILSINYQQYSTVRTKSPPWFRFQSYCTQSHWHRDYTTITHNFETLIVLQTTTPRVGYTLVNLQTCQISVMDIDSTVAEVRTPSLIFTVRAWGNSRCCVVVSVVLLLFNFNFVLALDP